MMCGIGACKNSILHDAFVGEFIIEGIRYGAYNMKPLLSLNIIEFYPNGNVKLPSVSSYQELKQDINVSGKWEVKTLEKEVILRITSNNTYFNGNYKVNFFKEPDRKAFVLYLNSKSLSVKCAKDKFNYVKETSLMDNAVELTRFTVGANP